MYSVAHQYVYSKQIPKIIKKKNNVHVDKRFQDFIIYRGILYNQNRLSSQIWILLNEHKQVDRPIDR